MADAGATKFSNPIADDGVALDPTAEVPTNGDSKAMDRNFDDDVEVSNAPVSVGYGESTDTYSPRSQERVNAHHVQKFVGEQSKHPRVQRTYAPLGLRSRVAMH
jgi:uncharacterized protein with von Willebrand factor type A (vWA) domain